MKTDIDDSLSKYNENYVEDPSPVNTLIVHILEYPTTTGKDQFSFLSLISNYHTVNNITLSTNTQQKKTFNRFMNLMLYHPDKNEESTGHIPAPNSPRMRLMYMLTSEKYEDTVGPHVKIILITTAHLNNHTAMSRNTMIIQNLKTNPQRRKGNKLQDL